MDKESQKPRRAPAGAAAFREDVTQAIRAAVFEELATVGYARMSIERVARRAGVGKAAVYRRWRSKLPIVLDVVSALAVQGMPAPDTGSLLGDVQALLKVTARLLQHPMAAQILPDLLAEAARNPDIAQALQAAVRDSQRGIAETIVQHAVARGELSADTSVDLALDLACGPLYWRLVMVRSPLPAGYLDGLARATTAALGAARTDR
ncbi:TetR/AcrR family transcriptional regulator [Streptomyces varsoviensis]|uniref:TetR family transcriptional regulator n=1 Tax=Streptomyces varsoviensis TaxID=67373 RepID=A0ABR5IWQ1_9ACTN|nr:TetR/AcrR family transcriptional regulator [Streptomyces varsoviensis]KOG85552.1 TetR family transcriptional regulator [Streptomyces varsoviensis]